VTAHQEIDVVTAEVVISRLKALCDEGMEAAMHVSASPIVYAVGDVQTGILLADGSPVIGSRGGGGITFRNAVIATLERCSENPGIHPGDMFVVNDPFLGPRHQPDVMIIAPVHEGDRLVAWVGTVCHHLDTGGMTAGGWIPGATEIYQEGYRLPPVKLVERGELRSDIFGALMNMVRMPDKVALDYRGQIAANNVIRGGFVELTERYGTDVVLAVLGASIERTRKRFEDRLLALPDGDFSQTIFLEQNDGEKRQLLRYVLAMTKRGSKLAFDFNGTSPQQAGPVNATLVNTELYGITQLLSFLVAPDIEFNDGIRKLFTLDAPLGSIVNPTPPAPVSAGVSLSSAAVQACLSKLVDCTDDLRDGAGGLWRALASLMVMMSGRLGDGTPFNYGLHDSDGHGCGARTYADGVDTGGDFVHNIALANVEFHETDSPILFSYRRQATDTGGAGEFRGGVGLEEAWRPHRTDGVSLTITSFGTEPPTSLGSSGGLPGGLNCSYVIRGDVAERLPAAVTGLTLTPDESLYIGTVGGGGYGDPLERSPAAVVEDVRGNRVSAAVASDVYGVEIAHGADGPELDEAATAVRRDEIRAARLANSTMPEQSATVDASGSRLTRIGAYLDVVAANVPVVCCARCGRGLCDVEHNHKLYAAMEETSLDAVPGLIDLPELVLRRFYCPGCAVQFWVDVAERGASVEWDVRLTFEGGAVE
jgi:N-methylhydantoinase B